MFIFIFAALLVCIYLMNDVVLHMELEDGVNTIVSELVRCITKLDELMLPENAKDIFTLWMNSSLLGNFLFNFIKE